MMSTEQAEQIKVSIEKISIDETKTTTAESHDADETISADKIEEIARATKTDDEMDALDGYFESLPSYSSWADEMEAEESKAAILGTEVPTKEEIIEDLADDIEEEVPTKEEIIDSTEEVIDVTTIDEKLTHEDTHADDDEKIHSPTTEPMDVNDPFSRLDLIKPEFPDMSAIWNKINQLEDKIADLSNAKSYMRKKIAELESLNDTLTEQISNQASTIQYLEGKVAEQDKINSGTTLHFNSNDANICHALDEIQEIKSNNSAKEKVNKEIMNNFVSKDDIDRVLIPKVNYSFGLVSNDIIETAKTVIDNIVYKLKGSGEYKKLDVKPRFVEKLGAESIREFPKEEPPKTVETKPKTDTSKPRTLTTTTAKVSKSGTLTTAKDSKKEIEKDIPLIGTRYEDLEEDEELMTTTPSPKVKSISKRPNLKMLTAQDCVMLLRNGTTTSPGVADEEPISGTDFMLIKGNDGNWYVSANFKYAKLGPKYFE